METKIWTSTASLHREDFRAEKEYRDAIKEYSQHYGYKVRVEGGYKFFEFENDYRTWKNQK
jgi:hypothetical protein